MSVQVFQSSGHYEVRFVDQAIGCERVHTHAYPVVTTVLGGSLSLQLGHELIQLRAGVVLKIAPHQPHAVRAFAADFAGVYTVALLDEERDWSTLCPDLETAPRLIDLCEHLLSLESHDAKAQQLSAWLETVYAPLKQDASADGVIADTGLAARVKQMLDAEPTEQVDFAAIARKCGCSKEHCNRQFRSRYALSMQTYYLNRKAERARTLLSTDLSLGEVALEAGFFDQSHMSRVFKGIFQVTPELYRRRSGQ